MSQEQPLKKEIPILFSEELQKRLAPGENILVKLPGSHGEAFVLTDKRAFVIREQPSGPNPELDIHSYWLTAVSGAKAEAQGTGGFIALDVEEAKSDPECAKVYFPAYDLDIYKAAADLVNKLRLISPAPVAEAVAAATPGHKCAKCSTGLPEHAQFCPQCGEQAAALCAYCNSPTLPGAAYCHHCGSKTVELQTSCATCGARTLWPQSYCRECGSVLVVTCAACGGRIMPEDKHCRYCGRLLGTDRMDPAMARSAARRFADMQARQTTPELPRAQDAEADSAEAPVTEAPVSEAERHNRLGRKLFEQEDTQEAIEEFRLAVGLEPRNPLYHCNLAVAYDEVDEDDLALAEYEKTLELEPNDLTALLSLGYMYNEHDDPDKAKQSWDKILQIAPLSAEAQEVQENLRHQGQL